MKKLLPIFTILFVVIILTGKSFAQQWSSEQKEIMAAEVKLWDAIQSGNTENFSQYVDDSYWDWDYQNSVPQNKTNDLKWLSNFLKGNSIVLYTLNPQTIWVKGDYAYIHYYYSELDKNIASGKEDQSEGNWTDIWVKKDGKWLIVGDHGGRTSKKL
jgi:ketosteroid isomerase-like protein